MNKCIIINAVTKTGKMKTWMKYILVTVAPESDVPPNINVATCSYTNVVAEQPC